MSTGSLTVVLNPKKEYPVDADAREGLWDSVVCTFHTCTVKNYVRYIIIGYDQCNQINL